MNLVNRAIDKVCATSFIVFGLVFGCGSASDSADREGPSAAVTVPIINATPITDQIGTPLLVTPVGICSSTLLDGDWLITAHHCVTYRDANGTPLRTGGTAVPPGQVTARLQSGASATADSIVRHATLDVALVHLSTGLTHAANAFYPGSSTDFWNSSLTCQGWGNNTPTGGGGTLRQATMPVTAVGAGVGYTQGPDLFGELQTYGDSGSSCYVSAGGQNLITGVLSHGTSAGGSFSVGADAFRDWAATVMCVPTPINCSCPTLADDGSCSGQCGTVLDNCGGVVDCMAQNFDICNGGNPN